MGGLERPTALEMRAASETGTEAATFEMNSVVLMTMCGWTDAARRLNIVLGGTAVRETKHSHMRVVT